MLNSQPALVGDYVTLQRGTTYEGAKVGKLGPPLLGLGSIAPGGGFRPGNFKTFGGVCPPKLMVPPGELYVALKGATKDGSMVGSVARLPAGIPAGRLTQDTARLDFKDPERGSVSFLYWVLRTPQYRQYCAGRLTGSAAASFSRDDFLSYPVPERAPSLTHAVNLLDAIESKIALNRRMAATLEEMARAVFQERIVAAEEAVHWAASTLGQIAEQSRGQVRAEGLSDEIPYIGLEHMPRRSIALTDWGTADGLASNKFAFKRGEILFGKLRPYFHKVGVAPLDGVCSTDIVVMIPKADPYFGIVLGYASSDEFVAFTNAGSTGTRMPRTSWAEMARYPIVTPPDGVVADYNGFIRPIIERIIAGTHESRTLAALRDALLPKLISGELRVKDAERFAKEVV